MERLNYNSKLGLLIQCNMPDLTDAFVAKWEQISEVSFQDVVERTKSGGCSSCCIDAHKFGKKCSTITYESKLPVSTCYISACQHSFGHLMYFKLHIQISVFLCTDLKYQASILTQEDLLHCEWSVLRTGAHTSLQAEAQIPAVLF